MRKKIFILIALYSLAISFFYVFFCYGTFSPFSLKFANINTKLEFDLPEKDAYILNIWNPRLPEEIYFNDRRISPAYVKSKKEVDVAYIIVPEDYVVKGVNTLYIPNSEKYSAKIRNFFGAAKSKNIYILHKSSRFLKEIKFDLLKFILAVPFVFILLTLILRSFAWLGVETLSIYWIPYTLYFLCFGAFFLSSLLSPLRLIISDPAFIILSLILLGIVKFPLLTIAMFKRRKSQQGSLRADTGVVSDVTSRIFSGDGDLSQLFVFLFMWFISFAVISMVFGLDILGEVLVNIAYLALVISVSMKIFKRLRNGLLF